MFFKLENMLGGEEVYKTHITKYLVPCIGQFAIAIGDDSQWKVLNYQVLLKTRHSLPKVRRCSKRCSVGLVYQTYQT